jgi:hypothetical protein
MPWWGWLLVGLGLASVLIGSAVRFRSQLMFAVKFARTLMSDQRVPRPLRWLIGISLAIKVVPFPDFGVDEVLLIVVGLVLVIFYRPALRAILEEMRSVEADSVGVEADSVGAPVTSAPKRADPPSSP